ncbi:toll-like receptor 6 [Stylophora pistillata]|uniref:toll-like receptor 6 n=1 Tax=Stylophora pistillata TaxID=50429 RepID=UPI000C04010A|nr:toll-like receptor 6 [Stylophora pistillata]
MPKTYKDILNGSYRLIDPYYYRTVKVKSNYGVEVTIVNVTEDDFGLYTCYASNHIGRNFRSAYLINYVKPTVPVTAHTSCDLNGTICDEPGSTLSPPNTEHTKNGRSPDKKTRNALLPGMLSVCLLIIVAVVIVFCWCRRSNRIIKKPSALLSKAELEYDAFIIFSSQDSDWVIKTLIPTLEEKHHFQCCVHYRDFVVGVPFRENMVNSVYISRKTIAVVSKNFFKSSYCGSEMEYALHRLMERRDDSVVVIKLDDVDRAKLPKELQKRSYIDYRKNVEKDHWERKLVNCLKIPNDQPQEQIL